MRHDMWIVDAFTKIAFRGNAAAICLLDKFTGDEDMQLTALQMQLSETAFVVQNKKFDYDLRWFTPEVEVDLCGHATLAAAHVLRQSGQVKTGEAITFHTKSGELQARILEKTIELNFPNQPPEQCEPPKALKHLGVPFTECWKSGHNYLVEVKNFETLVSCKPWFKKLATLDAQGVIVTTNKGAPPEFDFASRYFAPQVGVNEDPVTGSAHCVLAPYWAQKLGKTKFHALQASVGYGILDVTLKSDRILIEGSCVTTLKGSLPANKKKKSKENAA